MTVNKFRFTISDLDQQINIPVNIDFDLNGQEDLIKIFENDVIDKVINPIKNFETFKFTHNSIGDPPKSEINYIFNFFDYSQGITNTSFSDSDLWVNDYNSTTNPDFTGQSFTDKEIYYGANSFKKSFFKLDFYDSKNSSDQKNYFTIIIPTQQGGNVVRNIGTELVPNEVKIRIPNFKLDYVGDKEGFYIYFTEDLSLIPTNTFYMSVKFFNAKVGEFIRFLTSPQSIISTKFNFKKENYFYHKIQMDFQSLKYSIFNDQDQLIGSENNPINWYEYVNP